MVLRHVYRSIRAKAPYKHSRSFSQLHSGSRWPSFGIAFDIDGVILRGNEPIGNSPQALKRLYTDCGKLKFPFIFLTNGGGVPESKRAIELSKMLEVNIQPLQVVQGHSPFKQLVNRYENDLIVAVGKGEPAAVMSEYGFKKVISIDQYALFFDNIDPLGPYKKWVTKMTLDNERTYSKEDIYSERVKSAFIVSDPVDWSRDIQVLCDILRCGGLPGREYSHQPPLYFASDDLEYQAAFPIERLGMGAFRITLESIFNRISYSPLKYTSYGKPNPTVFENARSILESLPLDCDPHTANGHGASRQPLDTLYMVGDNPVVDIKGACQAGRPWFSILTRTGVFKGKGNHEQFPADIVVDTVEEAVDYILKKECRNGS
ncbi:uncharacterized protein YKR070W isoform X2 [Amborella trichopoda]|uniref:Uncharacterized protein n=2 Tax=Amborella trichopoda TaxID=13333 RepID=W1PGG0_AMBTC|nr:uncharacterized protein YKR070W isoform X2 [Amborella trichopoda]ERN06160.1 hypothetical protein AMTR_s00016p00112230 [Amborella trichopoda]|eukprot:XP_006844485.1 uncharacterized protein YKR070W isoform X2 [Amborella trichopoda]